MLRAKTRWKIDSSNNEKVEEIQNELQVSFLTAKLLVNRGMDTIETASRFLHQGELEFYDPYLLNGMKEAVERINKAIQHHERILIFGDYDADGVSSTTVMVYTMRQLGADFEYYIPNRFTEGYGPNEAAFRWAKEQGFGLIITVDTGISAVHEANIAKELEIDLIITDHHEAPPILPDSFATINPKKPGCTYPFKGLAGVGVAFKVAHALLGEVPTHLLDIAAIGTIADLVPLQDENRLLAKRGIKALQHSTKKGIKALLKQCGLEASELNAEHIGFGIGPRINAAGRLDSAAPAVELLITEDEPLAEKLAAEIDALNRERQALVNEMTKEAIEEVETLFPPEENKVLVIAKENWNAGVIGIVASRLVERFYRPTIVLSIDPEKGLAKGSARSIEGFDMFENLSTCRDILPHFGGHPMAAGMTLEAKNLEELRKRLDTLAGEKLTEEDFLPITSIDLTCKLDDITIETIEQMAQLAPFGVSNPTPKVLIEDVDISQIKRIGSDESHLKLLVKDESEKLDIIGFQFGYLFNEVNAQSKISVVGELSINEWNGIRKPQLMLQDIAVKEWQLFDYRSIRNLKTQLASFDKKKLLLVSFQEDTIDKLELQEWKDYHVCLKQNNESTLSLGDRYTVLLDLPDCKEQLVDFVQKHEQPERTYVVFFHEEDHFFMTIPSREHFKWFYSFLLKQKSFHMNQSEKLAKYRGWTKETVHFMIKVFLDLKFVTINDGLVSLNGQPEKRDLSESPTYKRKQAYIELENEFVYSSYQSLKKWFEYTKLGFDEFEEAAN
ncbi:single-stranded-DNA-specific exonuclease RecJ [Bacillus taeanensis]|uniref:Single-stranded-DNA-specific exonuclease RecJ n=1 Tax=Bacillus taeanensis TaxID=273032 RepID=A0A366Y060_9BACI|nr:single-stranded-DNA-specific exonuclease RecJ [Bacillus taeanensis]RBW70429.1 single-stranded-DNA-specific exonuclease RecJ [Bacillus taeanensis]